MFSSMYTKTIIAIISKTHKQHTEWCIYSRLQTFNPRLIPCNRCFSRRMNIRLCALHCLLRILEIHVLFSQQVWDYSDHFQNMFSNRQWPRKSILKHAYYRARLKRPWTDRQTDDVIFLRRWTGFVSRSINYRISSLSHVGLSHFL